MNLIHIQLPETLQFDLNFDGWLAEETAKEQQGSFLFHLVTVALKDAETLINGDPDWLSFEYSYERVESCACAFCGAADASYQNSNGSVLCVSCLRSSLALPILQKMIEWGNNRILRSIEVTLAFGRDAS